MSRFAFAPAAFAAAFVAVAAFAAPAFAGSDQDDLNAAIVACRAAVSEQTGAPNTDAAIDFDRSRTRATRIDVFFRVRADEGASAPYACRFNRSEQAVMTALPGTVARERAPAAAAE